LKTLYWHDYETWGEVPAQDKPSQFAGIRTDEDLNVVGDPLMIYCRPTPDLLPKPEACLVTGVTPQQALAEGLPECQFIAAIHRELAQPGTCGVGYNTIRFDDEVTRYALYRNFYDPYEREWKNGNSRWDIIDIVRLTYALRPEGIEWPQREDGKPSFKLEHLTAANGLAHEAAHDALSDVYATIAVARLIKNCQPRLYDYCYRMRDKRELHGLIDLSQRKPLLHISSMFPAENGCAALVAPIAMHPVNKNAVIVFDLAADPAPLLHLSPEQIAERLFTRQQELPEGVERLPLKLVHLNKCPVLATPKMVTPAVAQRLNMDLAQARQHWQRLLHMDIAPKLQQVYQQQAFEPRTDPEQMLYDGFLGDQDRKALQWVREASPEQLAANSFNFQDARLGPLLFRYRARNFPESLSAKEREQWEAFCYQRLTDESAGASIVLTEYFQRLDRLRVTTDDPNKLGILKALEEYGDAVL